MNAEMAKSLVKFQSLMGNLRKESVNPHYRNTYLNLSSLLAGIRQPLCESDLFLSQSFKLVDGATYLTTQLVHISGEYIESEMMISPDKPNIQGMGSAITYMRRYSIECITGVTGDDSTDDDGNAAVTGGYNPAMKPQNKNPDVANLRQPTDKMRKYYYYLLNRFYNEVIPEPILTEAKGFNYRSMSEAISELKGELGLLDE